MDVLKRLAAGEVLHHVGGLHPMWFFHAGERAINYRTVYSLSDQRLIETFKATSHSLDHSYRITDAGRKALMPLPDPPKAKP